MKLTREQCFEIAQQHYTIAADHEQHARAWMAIADASHEAGRAAMAEEAAGYHDDQARLANDRARDIMRRDGDDPAHRASARRWRQCAEEQQAAATRIRAMVKR